MTKFITAPPAPPKIVIFYVCDEQRRLYEVFLEMHNAGERTGPFSVCLRAGFDSKFLSNAWKTKPWRKELYERCQASLASWEIDGNGLLKKGKRIVKQMKKEGKHPNLKAVAVAMGYASSYFKSDNVSSLWQKKLRRFILDADNWWKKHGGWEVKAIREELTKCKKLGKKPVIETICSTANILVSTLNLGSYEWQRTIRQEMQEAQKEWKTKCHEEASLAAKIKSGNEAGLVPLELVGFTPDVLYERYIRQGEEIDAYRNIGVILDDKNPYALAKLMYRESIGVWKNVKVNPNSFDPGRKPLIDGCISMLNGQQSLASCIGKMTHIQKLFAYHLASESTEKSVPLILNADDAKTFYDEFTHHLIREFYDSNQSDSQARLHNSVKELLTYMFSKAEIKEITRGLPDVPNGGSNPVTVDLDEGTYTLSFYFNMFHQLADFILEGAMSPHPINFNGKRMLIAPMAQQIIQHEDRIYTKKGQEFSPKRFFNFETGRLKSEAEVTATLDARGRQNVTRSFKAISSAIEEFNRTIKNGDPHIEKNKLLQRTIECFFMLFSGMTGKTEAELKNAEWEGDDDEFRVHKEGYCIRTIKPRGKYRRFAFPISIYVKESLKKYLLLRRLWLQGSECSTLFPPDIRYRFIHERFDNINPELPAVRTIKLRKLYNQVVLKKTGGDLVLTAKLMGHTPRVNAENYQDTPQAAVDRQIGSFVGAMVTTARDENEIESKHSNCVNYQNGVSVVDENIKLDCSNIFHCLICKHFRTHPIEEDVHKLISFLYILTFYLAGRAKGDPEFIEGAVKPTESIIRTILDYMADKHGTKSLNAAVWERVFTHGRLSQGWARYFTFIRQLGGY